MCGPIEKTQELVSLAHAGNESALRQICQVYTERVRWMVRLRMGKELRSKLESMDLVQNTLIQALDGLGNFSYRNEGDFIRWLAKIVENEVRGDARKMHANKRDIRKEISLDRNSPQADAKHAIAFDPIQNTTPSIIASRKEDLARLERALDQLRPEYKEMIVMAKIEGLSYREIAHRQGKSSEAIRKLVSRAIAELTAVFRRL